MVLQLLHVDGSQQLLDWRGRAHGPADLVFVAPLYGLVHVFESWLLRKVLVLLGQTLLLRRLPPGLVPRTLSVLRAAQVSEAVSHVIGQHALLWL